MNVMPSLLNKYRKKKNKVIRGGEVLSILFFLLISLLIPPIDIYAQSLSSPFLGINVQVTAYGENAYGIQLPKINIEYLGSTVPSGYISGQLNCTSPSTPTSTQPCDVFAIQNSSGTGGASNGARIYLNLQQYLLEFQTSATIQHQSYFFIDYEFVLDDEYKGYVTFTDGTIQKTLYVNGNHFNYQRMQTDTSEHSIVIDDYSLTRVVDSIMWNIPTESLNACSLWLNRAFDESGAVDFLSFYQNAYNQYPIFKLNDYTIDQSIFYNNVTPDNPVTIIIISPQLSSSGYTNYIDISGSTISNISTSTVKSSFNMAYPDDPNGINHAWYFRRIDITTSSRGVVSVKFKANGIYFVPIFVGTKTNQKNIGTDFALNWGLSNSLLDNIDLLANGNNPSNTSSSNLETQKDSFDTTSNSLYSSENAFNTDMNSKLQSIDTSFNPSTSFGSKFLSSANWVRTQFDNITSTTPFGTVLSFSMLLGLSLLIIGKVFK